MDPIIVHVAIDSFAIQAERLRCPKLIGRPVVLAPADSGRPRVLAASREALASGVAPGTPLIAARRICPDLIALPPDVDMYAGVSDSIRDRLAPFAPFAAASGPKPGRFVLDLTGVTPTHRGACERAARAGREVERFVQLHPTLGVAATRLVSGIAASVLAPDGNLLDVPAGSEAAFLGPLPLRVLPTARGAFEGARLDLLNVRRVREVQALDLPQLAAAVGRKSALALWREARGIDGAPTRPEEAPPGAVAEETLAAETNDLRVLTARVARLAMEVGVGLRRRGTAALRLNVGVTYADGRHGRARRWLARPISGERDLRETAVALLEQAAARRIRIRRIRLEAWEAPPAATQLTLWTAEEEDGSGSGAEEGRLGRAEEGARRGAEEGPRRSAQSALERSLDRIRARFGTDTIVPASWIAAGVAVRPSPRP